MKRTRMDGFFLHSILAICILFLGSSQAFTDTITVMNTDDSGAGSLRKALEDASSDDTIAFDATAFPDADTGAITLTSGQLVVDKALTIDGDGRVTISGGDTQRVLYISYGNETSFVNVTLKGLKITNGKADYGAGVNCFELLTMSDCVFSNNNASIHGGGLILYYGEGTVSNCLFSDNEAGTNQYGGGLALYNGSNYAIDQCIFSENSANSGGAIKINSSTLTLTNSLLKGNESAGGGGGIYSYSATTNIHNSTMSGNSNQTTMYGNAMDNAFSDVHIINSTITGGTGGAGAVSIYDSTCHITSSIIAGNDGDDIAWRHGSYGMTVSHSLLESVDHYEIPDGANGNIMGQAPELSPLEDNGGPTWTHAILPDSPAIDAGSNSLSLDYDQRGQGYAREQGNGPDMGSFELWNTLIVTAKGEGEGTVISTPPGINFTYPISTTETAFLPSGVTTLLATAETGSAAFWNDCASLGGTVDGSGTGMATCSLNSIGSQKVITATFALLDSDNDGIPDKDEDKNSNGVVDTGETDPNKIDSDNDGIQDGTELGLTLGDVGPTTDLQVFQPDLDPTTTTNPLIQDSDGDGIMDGQEDTNHNGRMDLGESSAARKSGDINGDGSLSMDDAVLALRVIVDSPNGGDNLADIDGNGLINQREVLFLLRELVK